MNRAQERYLNNMIKSQAQDMETMKKKIDVIEKRLEVIAPTDDNGEKLTTYTAYEAMLEINRLKEYQETPHISKEVYLNVQARLNNLEQALKKVNIVL